MDSANSGSPQSSSGGDDDYDSRPPVDHSVFINHHPPRPSLFDPFSNYTQQQPQQQQPMPTWPGSPSLRSDANPQLHSLINPFTQSFQPPPMPQDDPDNKNSNPGPASTAAAPRNPRKRSRASRRAPTTVLTTDTTNFRAMVQEFTGIPAPPFSNPSFPRPHRLDNLFGPSRSNFEAAPPHFTRHPFVQTTPFLVPGSTTPTINYQQLPFSSHLHTSNNNTNNNILLSNINNNNNNNQNLFFSSLLQTNPSKFTFSSSPIMASKPHNQAGPGPDDFGLGGHGTHHHLHLTTPNDLLDLIPSDQGPARDDRDDERDAAKWSRNNGGDNNVHNESDKMGRGDVDQLKHLNRGLNFSSPTSTSCQGEKGSGSGSGPENTGTARVSEQGMVESWINNSSE